MASNQDPKQNQPDIRIMKKTTPRIPGEAGNDTATSEQVRHLEAEVAHRLRLKRALQHLADTEEEVAQADYLLGLVDEATQMQDNAAGHYNTAAKVAHEAAKLRMKETEIVAKDAAHLARALLGAPRETLIMLSEAVVTLTIKVQQITPEEIAQLAQGRSAVGQRLRERAVRLGTAIKQALAFAIKTFDQARRIVKQLSEFVAAVLTIADKVKWLFALYTHFGPVLAPFEP